MTNYTEALFNEKDYPRAKEFLPERWLTEDGREVLKELPKSYMPFGVGWLCGEEGESWGCAQNGDECES